jgi:hypothetical protein
MQRLIAFWLANRSVAVVTFEVFWIVVFLLERAASSAGQVPEFMYANF